MEDTQQSFWDHLDELRRVIFRILGVALAFAVVAFIFRDELFAVVLAPKENCFITYRLLSRLASVFSGSASRDDSPQRRHCYCFRFRITVTAVVKSAATA